MAHCELCKKIGSAKIKYDLDSAREHAKTHFQQLNIVDDPVSEDQTFENCFPLYQPTASRRGKPAKSSSQQILIDVCHSLFPRERILESPPNIACARCVVEFKLINHNKSLNTTKLIDHACSHLDERDLYACRHCSRQCQSIAAVRNHLGRVHRINSTNGHFDDKSHKFVKEISHQIESCFGQSAKSGDLDRKCRQILVDLCQSLFPRNRILEPPPNVACAKCGVEYKLARRDKSLNTTKLIDHACSHLDEKGLYACRHCSRKYQSIVAVRNHLGTVHRTSSTDGHFENKCHNHMKEISHWIKKCFGQNTNSGDFDRNWARTALKIKSQHQGSDQAIERQLLCHQLIRKIADRDQRVKCRLCSSRLSVKDRDGYSSQKAMQHILLHLQKPTMRCRICSEVFISRFKLQEHFRNVHSLPMTKNYECVADEFHTEILSLLGKCFGTEVDGNATGDTIVPRSETIMRQNARGSKLAIERNLLCHKLIRKFASREKRLKCRLCSKLINAKQAVDRCTTESVMQHALKHMAKPLYRCKQCTKTYSFAGSMVQHLRKKHALTFGSNHVCFQDEYHSEILDILRECYGDERNGVKTE